MNPILNSDAIAIVDSGVDTNNESLMNTILGGIGYIHSNNYSEIKEISDIQDENGHGTSCAAIINRVAPKAKLVIIKILDRNCLTSSKALLEALKFLSKTDIKLINISATSEEKNYLSEYQHLIEILHSQGKIIFSSLGNRCRYSIPASLSKVIGVESSVMKESTKYWFNSEYEIQCVADITPVYVPTINGRYTLFGGNSKATAYITGIIYNLLSENGSMDYRQIVHYMEKHTLNRNWTFKDICKNLNYEIYTDSNHDSILYDKHKIAALNQIIYETLNITPDKYMLMQKYKLYHPLIGLNGYNCYEIVQRIEKAFDKRIDYNTIALDTFSSVYSIYSLIH